MKTKILLLLSLLFFSIGSLYGESVFLKDGRIFTGEIKDLPGENSISIKGKKFSRNEILRINITDDHRHKRYFYARDGKILEGYVVKESFDQYIFRLKLESPEEKSILKKDLYFVTLKKIYLAKGKKMPQVDPPLASGQKQAVFLKDGRIIEGRILSETKKQVVIKNSEGKRLTFPKKEVRRTIYNDSYKHPFYLYKFNNFYDRAYIVGEDSQYYFLKDELTDRSEDDVKKSKYNFVSFSPIPLDTTKYEYPDISFHAMYLPIPGEHMLMLGLDWTDPVRPSILPYWMHWTLGLSGLISVSDFGGGGILPNTGFTFDIWRFFYARLQTGGVFMINTGQLEIGMFGLVGAGVRFTFEDFFFLGIEAGAIFAGMFYNSDPGGTGGFNVIPQIYLTFGFNFY